MVRGSLMKRFTRKKLPGVVGYKTALWAYKHWHPLEQSLQRNVILRMISQTRRRVLPYNEEVSNNRFNAPQIRRSLRKGSMKRLVSAGIGLPSWRACLKREVFNDT